MFRYQIRPSKILSRHPSHTRVRVSTINQTVVFTTKYSLIMPRSKTQTLIGWACGTLGPSSSIYSLSRRAFPPRLRMLFSWARYLCTLLCLPRLTNELLSIHTYQTNYLLWEAFPDYQPLLLAFMQPLNPDLHRITNFLLCIPTASCLSLYCSTHHLYLVFFMHNSHGLFLNFIALFKTDWKTWIQFDLLHLFPPIYLFPFHVSCFLFVLLMFLKGIPDF